MAATRKPVDPVTEAYHAPSRTLPVRLKETMIKTLDAIVRQRQRDKRPKHKSTRAAVIRDGIALVATRELHLRPSEAADRSSRSDSLGFVGEQAYGRF